MAISNNKKRPPLVLFGLGFVVVLLLAFIANWRSALVSEVKFPLNNGVAYLSAIGDHLVAVCHDSKVYVWNWNNLSANPRSVNAQSDQAGLLQPGRVISVRESNANKIVVAGLDAGKVYNEIPVSAYDKQVRLAVSSTGETVVVALVNSGANSGRQQVAMVDCDAGQIRPIVELAKEGLDRIMGIAVSDDGGLVVLVGEKDGQGYMVLVNVEEKRVAWTKTLPDLQKVRNAVFSTDSRVIYIRGTDSSVQVLNADTGSVVKKLLPIRENKSTAGDQNVQTLTASADGRFVAASVGGGVYVWNCKSDKIVFHKGPGHKLVSGLAFSPDSKFLATSDSRQGGVIKIWRIPKR